MAADHGRNTTITIGAVEYTGIRSKSITFAKTNTDISDQDSAGVRELLGEDAENSVDITVEGLVKGSALQAAYHTSGIVAVLVTYSDGATLGFDAKFSAYSEGHPYKEAVTFTATLQSTGAITFTEAS